MNLLQIINDLKQIAAECDKVTSGNVSHKIANIEQGILNITYYLEHYCELGWHPASEVPQINKKVVAITTNGKAQEDVYYDGNRYCWNGLTIKIKWWCYPPKEE